MPGDGAAGGRRGHAPRRVDRRRVPRRPIGRRVARPSRAARQQQVRRRAAHRDWPTASVASSSTRSTSSTASRRWWARGCRVPKVLVRITPGRRGPHPRVRAHRPGRLEVRVRGGVRGGRGRAGPGRRRHQRSSWWACTPTSAARCSKRASSSWPSRRWRPSSSSTRWPSCRSVAGWAWPTSRARRHRRITEWADAVHRACARAGHRRSRHRRARPRRSSAAAAVTLYTVGTIKDLPGIRTYVSVDGGMSDNPRPVLYGSGYETFLARAVDAERDRVGARGGQALRVGRPVGPRGSGARRPGASATCCAHRSPGAYGHSMGSNYNKVPRPAVVFVARRRGPGRRAARDLRRPVALRGRVGQARAVT